MLGILGRDPGGTAARVCLCLKDRFTASTWLVFKGHVNSVNMADDSTGQERDPGVTVLLRSFNQVREVFEPCPA